MICKHTTECGPLGEIELTISYKRHAVVRQTQLEPGESETVTIYWIKVGGINGVEVDVAEDYINDEIIPACIEDYHEGAQVAAEARADERREEMRRAA